MICDIEPRPDSHRIGPVAAGKLLARKRPHLLPVSDSRVKKVLNRPRADNRWWHDLRDQLISDQKLVRELESVRHRAGAGHMSLLRVFDVMCWMFSWEGEHGPCGQEMPDQLGKATVPVSAIWHVHWKQDRHLPAELRPDNHHRSLPPRTTEGCPKRASLPRSVTISPDASGVICRSAQLSRRWLCRSAPCRSNLLSRAVGPVCMLNFVGLLAGLPHMPMSGCRSWVANSLRYAHSSATCNFCGGANDTVLDLRRLTSSYGPGGV